MKRASVVESFPDIFKQRTVLRLHRTYAPFVSCTPALRLHARLGSEKMCILMVRVFRCIRFSCSGVAGWLIKPSNATDDPFTKKIEKNVKKPLDSKLG